MIRRLLPLGLLPVVITAMILSTLALYTGFRSNQLPPNNPENYIKNRNEDKTVVVCAGDSLTHGVLSSNYVNLLQSESRFEEYDFINAGINGELSYNLLQRADKILACDPDYITILIGSNDVLATLSSSRLKRYYKKQNIPRDPDISWFESNLSQLIIKLKEGSNAEIAVLSLPPLGEVPEDPAFILTAKYARISKRIARKHNVSYLPLFENMSRLVKEFPQKEGSFDYELDRSMDRAAFQYYVRGKSWNEISADKGLMLLTDNIHLNDDAAEMIYQMIEEFILSHPPSAH